MFGFLGKVCGIFACMVLGVVIFNIVMLIDVTDFPPVNPTTEETQHNWFKNFHQTAGFEQSSREPTHYEILGIPNCSPDEDIKAARRQSARENHPDKFQGYSKIKAAEKTIKINRSADFLLTNSGRCTYDLDIGCGTEHTFKCLEKRDREFEEKIKRAREERKQERQATGAESTRAHGRFEHTRTEETGGRVVFQNSEPFFQWLGGSIRWLLRFLFRFY